MSILVIAEHDHRELAPPTLHTVTAAGGLDGDIHLLVAGSDCAQAAAAAARVEGVSRVLVADDAAYAHQSAENLSNLIAKIAEGYSHVLIPATKAGKNILPRAAALLDLSPISDVSGIESGDTFIRPIYAGNAIATVQSVDRIKMISVRATAFDAAADQGGEASVEAIESSGESGLSSFVGHDLTRSERPDLTAARIVVSGGRGMQNGENFAMLERVADKLGAAVGASRAAVDAGFVPNDYQVGQTGKVVAPDLYIVVGISGAIQHLEGMKESKVIVAINKDEEAPIFQVADYGLVADLFEAVPELDDRLSPQ